MADDAYHLFDLSDTPSLVRMSATYLQPQILWQLCPLPPQLISCVISMLRRKSCNQEIYRMCANRGCAVSGPTSASPCQSYLLSKMHPSLKLKSCRYMGTGLNILTTTSNTWNELGKIHFLRHGVWLRQPTSLMASPIQESLPEPRPTQDCTDVSPVSLKPRTSRTLLSN